MTIWVGAPRFGCSQPGHLYADYSESPHTAQAGWGDKNSVKCPLDVNKDLLAFCGTPGVVMKATGIVGNTQTQGQPVNTQQVAAQNPGKVTNAPQVAEQAPAFAEQNPTKAEQTPVKTEQQPQAPSQNGEIRQGVNSRDVMQRKLQAAEEAYSTGVISKKELQKVRREAEALNITTTIPETDRVDIQGARAAYEAGEIDEETYYQIEDAYREQQEQLGTAEAVDEALGSVRGNNTLASQNLNSYNNNTMETEDVTNGRRANLHLRDGAQRSYGQNTGGQVPGVAEAAGGVQERYQAGRSQSDGGYSQGTQGRVNAGDLGIPGGTGEANLQRVDAEYSADTREAARIASENGLEAVFFTGDNLFVEYEGKVEEGKACIVGNKAYIRADHPGASATQLMKHELAHHKIDSGLIDTDHVYDMLVEFYGEAKLREIIAAYAAAYDMGDTSVEAAARAVFVEIVCDSEAGINYFGAELNDEADGIMRNVRSATQVDMYSRETRGPPAGGNIHFKKETRKVKSFLRHFTGEVREDEYIELANIEKATVKSNIKTGFAHIAPDARRGIVIAHDINREYTYYFTCNTDYSVTVIDVFDNVTDAEIIDGLQKEITKYDRTGVQHSGKSVSGEGYGSSNRSDDSSPYEKTEPGKSATGLDERTSQGYWQRDSGPGRENSEDSGADTARNTEKVKLSRETAAEQRELIQSQQFKRWFGDWQNDPQNASKVVNEDGTPRVMYHGSPAQFTIFDKKKAKYSGQYGRGFYFTNSQSHASTYGQQYSVYLNIRNPLEYGRDTVSRAQVQKFLESVAENEDYSIENYGTYDVGEILDKVMGKNASIDAFQLIQDVNITAIGDMVEAAELFNQVNGTEFDGIVAATETVAFYPNQIKSATDNIGTFDANNPDIRFSRESDLEDGQYAAGPEVDQREALEELRHREEAEYADTKEKLASGELKPREQLTTKAKNYLQKAERKLLNKIRYALSVPRVATREYLKGTVEQVAALTTGLLDNNSDNTLWILWRFLGDRSAEDI